MNSAPYIAVSVALGVGVVAAFAVMIVSFIAMIVRWKTARRRRHVVRLLVAIAAIPCLIGIQQAVIWWVYMPALARQKLAEVNAARAESLAATSLVHVGDPVPPFSLTTADGVEFSMVDAGGDVVVINFFATWCGPCQVELPHIEQIWDARRNDDHFRLLVIGREETNDSVRQFRDEKGFTFPIAADPDRAVYSLFAEESIPRTLVVSPDGVIVYSKAGFMEEDLDELNAVLEEQLAM